MDEMMYLKQIVRNVLPASLLDLIRLYKYKKSRLKNSSVYQEFLRGKAGIEIGGPSAFFRYRLPIYQSVSTLDGVNFADKTMWEGVIQSGGHFEYAPGRVGLQLIAEATSLEGVESGQYQFLLSSNCLEHVANPLKALKEWRRVIQPGGCMLLVLPKQSANFDHRRPVTQFEHLLDDEAKATTEHDMTHLQEILELHDLSRDPWAGTRENFINRCNENYKYRGMHHHVFDMALMKKMVSYVGMSVLLADEVKTDFVILAKVPD